MNRQLFDHEWQFYKGEVGENLTKLEREVKWEKISIPHDWAIGDPNRFYETAEGWYKKTFKIEVMPHKRYYICFDGVYMNTTVFVNGQPIGNWKYGYSSFSFDMSSALKNGTNTILVRVDYECPNSRWYSGAGIYRHVWLKVVDEVAIKEYGIYAHNDGASGRVKLQTEIENTSGKVQEVVIRQIIEDQNKQEVASKEQQMTLLVGENELYQNLEVENPKLWCLESPYLYHIKTVVYLNDRVIDTCITPLGFRSLRFDQEEGFFLNEKWTKLKGVCLHHDLGALGSALNEVALRRQLMLMKEMGANAIRTSHNMPAPELMDMCDELGLLVCSEGFDMWELSKTTYDYSRFFEEWSETDVKSWVRRDRNHPSLIMWSIGNEIYDTHVSIHGLEIASKLRDEVAKEDFWQNGVITIGSNYMTWENAQKVADALKYAGYNYNENLYDAHHEAHPDWIIYGSETSSAVRSRGIYHFPAACQILTHDDQQCSSLGNSVVGWGKKAEDAWIQDRDRKFCLGQFVWTGIDYIGEPTPYQTKNAYFGMVDTAGLPKDIYYFYQSIWRDYKEKPMVHLLPYWDFNEGETIDVIAYTNAPAVELFLNDQSLGKQMIDHKKGDKIFGSWQVPYTYGTLIVKAYDELDCVIATDEMSSFGECAALVLEASKTQLKADGRDLSFITIAAVDEKGNLVHNARNRVQVKVKGKGCLVGLDNGDSTDYESYQSSTHRLFSGKLVAIVASQLEAGGIEIEVTSPHLKSDSLKLTSIEAEPIIGSSPMHIVLDQLTNDVSSDEVPIRKIELIASPKVILSKDMPEMQIQVKTLPNYATYNDLIIKVVKDNGVESDLIEADYIEGKIHVKAVGDGKCRLRVMAYNGAKYPQVISDLSIEVRDFEVAKLMPYTFISASRYTASSKALNVIEKGAIGGFTERTWIGYEHLTFGKNGANKLRLYVGNSDERALPIEIWEGIPDEGRLLKTILFEPNGRWDGFEPCEFELPEVITGECTMSFVVQDKMIFGGIEFVPIMRAFEPIKVAECDEIYGDEYIKMPELISAIGNNVVIQFNDLDFGIEGATKLVICGKTANEVNTIQLRYTDDEGQKTELISFKACECLTACTFDIEKICNSKTISFIFLPGSHFDFAWFKFEK